MVLTLFTATELSWTCDYRGDAAQNLHRTLERNLAQSTSPYAHFVTIVQSSGTGKSRMTDELGKSVVSIPLSLSTFCMFMITPKSHMV